MVYVPSRCLGGAEPCRLHFSLHGCGVNEYYDEAVQHLGFQDWGERSILHSNAAAHCNDRSHFTLCPQQQHRDRLPAYSAARRHRGDHVRLLGRASDGTGLHNSPPPLHAPKAYVDTIHNAHMRTHSYAQSGVDYALKSGAQMHAVRQMIAAIGGPPL